MGEMDVQDRVLMEKGDDGVWTYQTEVLDPELYSYLDEENAIFFDGQYLPPAGSSIEVAYYRLRG